MSTTARKLRKRSGVKFVHPTKVATPIHERHENGPNVRRENGTIGVSRRGRKRLNDAAQRLIESKLEGEEAALDPKPFRIGRKRYTLAETVNIVDLDGSLVFSPRKGYNPAPAAYVLAV